MPESITLSQYNRQIKMAIAHVPQGVWVIAETIDVSVRRGHCYLELIEKSPETGAIVARLGAVIWASVFARLNAAFRRVTGSDLTTGMKVLVRLNANFHEQYGLKAVVTDLDPNWTLGEVERRRREILNRLQAEGLVDRQRNLSWPAVPQRIAVVSAPGAAGYDDFVHHLDNNPYGLKFYTCLFQALMQGENTAPSVLNALQRIEECIDLFDCVVITRGGGATADLNAFDNYDMAARVARFAIPVIVGIGHNRDFTVLDYVGAMYVKTPTAAADMFIGRGAAALAHLDELRAVLVTSARETVAQAREQLAYYGSYLPTTARRIIETENLRVSHLASAITPAARVRLDAERSRLAHCAQTLRQTVGMGLERERLRLSALADKVALLSPQNTLNRGYALVERDGRFVTDAHRLAAGEQVTLHLRDGQTRATIG